jgi:hypothetical protein
MFNADTSPTSFVLPELPQSGRWHLAIDTAQPSVANADVVVGALYAVGSRASAILVGSGEC